ncbi:MAG: hypothetical protein GOV00_01005, partial [Candidatus Altiarchaeota archaeon]|nr:hypothetical protein [Candidatus Altiarchaeota archaeon]
GDCDEACGADAFCDERSRGYSASSGTGCPGGSNCVCAFSPGCQAYDRDATSSICQSGTSHLWIDGNYGDYKVDSDNCGSGVTCGDGNPANGFCCGDENGENPITEAGTADAPSGFKDGTEACCDTSTDCVESNVCTSNGVTKGSKPTWASCLSGTWYGGDDSWAACEDLTGSVSNWMSTFCCGDDNTEYTTSCVDNSVNLSCSGGSACCDSTSDCVQSGTCYNSGSSIGDAYCYNGEWIDTCPFSTMAWRRWPPCSSYGLFSCIASECYSTYCGSGWVKTGASCCGCWYGFQCNYDTCTSTCTCSKPYIVDTGNDYFTMMDSCVETLSYLDEGDECGFTNEDFCNGPDTFSGGVTYQKCATGGSAPAGTCNDDTGSIECISGGQCIYGDPEPTLYANGAILEIGGYDAYCSSGIWTSLPNGQSCTHGVECTSDLCVTGTCRASCEGYDVSCVSFDSLDYSDCYNVCADYDNEDGAEMPLPGLMTNGTYVKRGGVPIGEGNSFDYSDALDVCTYVKTATASSNTITQPGFRYDAGSSYYISTTTDLGVSSTYAHLCLPFTPSGGSGGYGTYIFYTEAFDDAGTVSYYAIGNENNGQPHALGTVYYVDEISSGCSISCSGNIMHVNFTTVKHEQVGETGIIELKGCYDTPAGTCISEAASICETECTPSGTCSSSCNFGFSVVEAGVITGYANDKNNEWIDTDSDLSCGTVPELDSNACWCSAGGGNWFAQRAGSELCCKDDSEDFLNSTTDLCDNGNFMACNSGTEGTSAYIVDTWYYCDGSIWVVGGSTADSDSGDCAFISGVWTGNECCGNSADTDGDDAGVTGDEGSDNYVDGTWGCNDGTTHECTAEDCYGLDLDNNGPSDTWCTAQGWEDIVYSADICTAACTGVAGGSWGSYWLETSSSAYCCGDDGTELVSDVLDSSTCTVTTGPKLACCEDEKCGWLQDGVYSCISEGAECDAYTCGDGEWITCDASSMCVSADVDNDGLLDNFCDNATLTWKTPLESVDFCEYACNQTGGMFTNWTFVNTEKYCCNPIQPTETWCAGTYPNVVNCDAGDSTDCDDWCDNIGGGLAIVEEDSNYACSNLPGDEGDCVSDTCDGGTCNCKKYRGIACTNDAACWSGSCTNFTHSAGESVVFDIPDSPVSSNGICCDVNACPYDSDANGVIDSCAVSDSAVFDADTDGDIDYCLNTVWYECETYSCTDAGDCGCAGIGDVPGACGFYEGTPGTYSTGNGFCFGINDTSIDPKSAFTCGMPCDLDVSLDTREYINESGSCARGGGGCADIFTYVDWFGNTSDLFLNQSSDCMCDSSLNCKLKVFDGNEVVDIHNLNFAEGTSIVNIGAVNLSVGNNVMSLECSCGDFVTGIPNSCEKNITAIEYGISTTVVSEALYCNNPGWLNVTAKNAGNIQTSTLIINGTITGGATISFSDTSYNVVPGAEVTKNFYFANIECSLFTHTNVTGQNFTSLIQSVSVWTDVGLADYTAKQGRNYQCVDTSDCEACCLTGGDNCWTSGVASNYVCSSGVCCEVGDHFENGACCDTGFGCCLNDVYCDSSEWCANQTVYSTYGNAFTCVGLRNVGYSCAEDRMCSSVNCEDSKDVGTAFCCSLFETVTDVASECHSETADICESSTCCSSDVNCAAGDWCTTNGKRCVSCVESGDEGFFNGYCVSSACTSFDADCCDNDDNDCTTADTLSGVDHYCEDTVKTCTPCSTTLDYYCPSNKCYESGVSNGDPDCCSSTSDCVQGSICTGGKCIPEAIGKYCKDSESCGSGSFSCIDSRCILADFVTATPTSVELEVGQMRKIGVIIIDPQMKDDRYSLSLAGTCSMFATLAEGKTATFSLAPGGVQKFTMTVYGGREESGCTIKLIAVSNTNPEISYEKSISVTVNVGALGGGIGQAPGISMLGVLMTFIIGGMIFWTVRV